MRQSESKVTMMLGENVPNSFDWIGETVTARTTVLLVYTHIHTASHHGKKSQQTRT